MGGLALLLLALCLVTRTCGDSYSDDEDPVEGYREVRETLKEIFAHGVDPEQQEHKDATSAGRQGTWEGMALSDIHCYTRYAV